MKKIFFIIFLLFARNILYASGDSVPYIFQSGTTAKASEVNANFNFLANKLATGGFYNLMFPDGLANITPIISATPYTVPDSKNLYITRTYIPGSSINNYLSIDGVKIDGDGDIGLLIVGEGQTVAGSVSGVNFNGFLVKAKVTPVIEGNIDDNNYTVPNGKVLFITNINIEGSNNYLSVNNKTIAGTGDEINMPIILGEGETVSGNSVYVRFNGYLRDK